MAKKKTFPLPLWSLILPLSAWGLYFIGISGSGWLEAVAAILLAGSVLSAVYHAEVVAHKVGEPFGAIILAVAITIIEVALIISLMVAGGEMPPILPATPFLRRCLLILATAFWGLCLLIGGWKCREQFFGKKSANTALIVLVRFWCSRWCCPISPPARPAPPITMPS